MGGVYNNQNLDCRLDLKNDMVVYFFFGKMCISVLKIPLVYEEIMKFWGNTFSGNSMFLQVSNLLSPTIKNCRTLVLHHVRESMHRNEKTRQHQDEKIERNTASGAHFQRSGARGRSRSRL